MLLEILYNWLLLLWLLLLRGAGEYWHGFLLLLNVVVAKHVIGLVNAAIAAIKGGARQLESEQHRGLDPQLAAALAGGFLGQVQQFVIITLSPLQSLALPVVIGLRALLVGQLLVL